MSLAQADSGIDTVLRGMWNNPQALIHEKVGTPGYTLPGIETLRWHELSSDAQIHENLIVQCIGGNQNNWLLAPEDWILHQNLTITLYPHASNNIIVVGRNANIFGAIYLHNLGGLIIIGEDTPHISMFDMRLYHENALIFWGKESTSNGTYMVLQGATKHIVVGG